MQRATVSIWSGQAIKPEYTPSNLSPRAIQWSSISFMFCVRSRKVKPVVPTVCVERTAVGRGTGCMPMLERTGMAAVRLVRPMPEMSWMVTTRGMGLRMLSASCPIF